MIILQAPNPIHAPNYFPTSVRIALVSDALFRFRNQSHFCWNRNRNRNQQNRNGISGLLAGIGIGTGIRLLDFPGIGIGTGIRMYPESCITGSSVPRLDNIVMCHLPGGSEDGSFLECENCLSKVALRFMACCNSDPNCSSYSGRTDGWTDDGKFNSPPISLHEGGGPKMSQQYIHNNPTSGPIPFALLFDIPIKIACRL